MKDTFSLPWHVSHGNTMHDDLHDAQFKNAAILDSEANDHIFLFFFDIALTIPFLHNCNFYAVS